MLLEIMIDSQVVRESPVIYEGPSLDHTSSHRDQIDTLTASSSITEFSSSASNPKVRNYKSIILILFCTGVKFGLSIYSAS
jgi:hypothetical protein